MADIERIAMVLSKSSKTVADWKLKFPLLQETMKIKLSSEMEKVIETPMEIFFCCLQIVKKRFELREIIDWLVVLNHPWLQKL